MKLFLTLLFACALSASGVTYYIDYGAADDSANGTSTSTPWKRHPYMTGFAGSYGHTAGDRFIFKGGVIWPAACFPLTAAAGGSSASVRDVYTTDPAWGTGRAIFDQEGVPINQMVKLSQDYIHFADIELRRMYWDRDTDVFPNAIIYQGSKGFLTVSNCIFTNWNHAALKTELDATDHGTDTAGAFDSMQCIYAWGSTGGNEVVDCAFNAGSGAGSGGCVRNGYNVRRCSFTNASNAILGLSQLVEDCDISNVDSIDPNIHENALQTVSAEQITVRRNYFHDTYAVTILVGNGTGEQLDCYNNLFYNTGLLDLDGRSGSWTNRIFNNTFIKTGGPAIQNTLGGDPATTSFVSNNLVINGTLASGTVIDGNNLILSTAQATAAGMTLATRWKPTSGSAVNGGITITAVATDKNGVSRPQGSAHDIGAYEYDPVASTNWFVSTSGSSSGAGTWESPWDIATGLATNAVTSGDTVWLRAGTYGVGTNVFACTLKGASNNPIIVRNYSGEIAIVDGGINAAQGTSSNVWFWGFEITCSTTRTNSLYGRPIGLTMDGMGCKAINLVLHDTGHPGIGSFATISGGKEIYGCIIWGTGIYQYHVDGDAISTEWTLENLWTRGAGTYLQNSNGTFVVAETISGRNFTEGQKAYSESLYARGFTFDGNITFKNDVASIMVDNLYQTSSNITVINNFDYRSSKATYGYFSDGASFAVKYGLFYSNNYTVSYPGYRTAALWFKNWGSLTSVSNTVVTVAFSNEWMNATLPSSGNGSGGMVIDLFPWTNGSPTYIIDRNKYHGGVERLFYADDHPFRYYTSDGELTTEHTFATWTNTRNFDINSTWSTNLPTVNIVTIRTNKYEPGRAHIVVYNWASNSTVTVNLSTAGLTNGQRYEIRDAQNYLGTPIVSASTYSGGTVEISLTSTNITPISGNIEHKFLENPNIHTASLFNTFVVLPLGEAPSRRTLNVSVRINAGSVR